MDKNDGMKDVEFQIKSMVKELKRMKEKTQEISLGLSEFEEGICDLRDSLYNFRVKYLVMKGGKRDE